MSAYTMDGVAELKDLVLEDLQHAASLFQVALEKRELPDSIPDRVIYSTLGTLLLCQTIVVLLLPKGRKLIWDVFETVVATVLALLLVLVILGLPIGAVYIGFKGTVFMVSSLLQAFPQLRELVNAVYQQLRLRG